jgi:integrase
MPRKYQNGKLEVRNDVKRPYYFVRVNVPVIDALTGERKQMRDKRMLGFCDEITKKRALELRAELLDVVNQGRALVQSQIRFKDLVKRFVDMELPLIGVATQARYQSQIDNHLLPAFGERRLNDIDQPAVQQFLTIKAESLGWWSLQNLRSLLSTIFLTAKRWKLWEGDNPTTGARIGKKKLVREKRKLKIEEFRTLLAALPDHLRFLVLILFGLGLRISEALALKWRDIDFGQATVNLQRRWYRGDLSAEGEMKNESSAVALPVSATLLDEFRRRYPGPAARDQFLFVGPDGVNPPDDRDLLRYEFRPVLVRLELYYKGFGWHAFRRQNITWKQELGGATPLEAQKAGRHSSLDMTYLYTLTDPERETLQQQRMFEALLGKADGNVQ